MRNAIYAVFLLACVSTAAIAQTEPEAVRPANPAPAATADNDTRDKWCQSYTSWFVAQTPVQGPAPADARPTQRLETEISSCKLDPQQYERETVAELNFVSPDRASS